MFASVRPVSAHSTDRVDRVGLAHGLARPVALGVLGQPRGAAALGPVAVVLERLPVPLVDVARDHPVERLANPVTIGVGQLEGDLLVVLVRLLRVVGVVGVARAVDDLPQVRRGDRVLEHLLELAVVGGADADLLADRLGEDLRVAAAPADVARRQREGHVAHVARQLAGVPRAVLGQVLAGVLLRARRSGPAPESGRPARPGRRPPCRTATSLPPPSPATVTSAGPAAPP